jgi:hypothetical protein
MNAVSGEDLTELHDVLAAAIPLVAAALQGAAASEHPDTF